MSIIRFSETIIRTLELNLEGLILVNGYWGTGKTYYFSNDFRELYSHKPVFYISTLGINTFSDFKERLIATTYLDISPEITDLKNGVSSILNSYQENSGEAFNNIVGIFGNAAKEKFLEELTGTFIIDDIERIDSDVCQKILTYCLQHLQKINSREQSNKVKYIIIGNSDSRNPRCMPRGGLPRKKPQKNSRKRRKLRTSSLIPCLEPSLPSFRS